MNIDDFLKIEQKYDLYNKCIDGVQYWMYARVYIFNFGICKSGLQLGEVHKKKKYSNIEKIQLAFDLAYNFVFKRKISNKNVDIVFLNHERRIRNGKYFDCVYTEKLSKHYVNSVTLEKPFEYGHFKPTTTNNLIYLDYVMIKGYLALEIHKRLNTAEYKRLYDLVENQIKPPLEELKHIYSWEVENKRIYELIVEKIILYKKEYIEYEKIISKLKPEVIIEVVAYCMQNMIINEIAKKKGIATIEIQHGIIYPEHAGYQFAEKAKISQLPDKVFLFSDFWKKQMQLPIPEENLIATGYPFFEEQIGIYRKVGRDTKKKTILFISQGTIGKYLSRLAVELSRLLPLDKFHIIYKLHPAEYQTWKETYPDFQTADIEVADYKESIYQYFANSDIQIGVYSTALYEGIGFGLQTLILRVGYFESMKALVDNGHAQYIDCAEDVVTYINEKKEMHVDGTALWKSNALQNMKNEIDSLLSERQRYV